MKNDKNNKYTNCTSYEDKYICPNASRGNWRGKKNGETRPDFGMKGA